MTRIRHELSVRTWLRTLRAKAAGRRIRRTLRALQNITGGLDSPVRRCEPEKAKVVVLAPHMDDEVLGCGGTIARHVAAGADVTVIFLTDGRHGGVIPDGSQSDLVTVRKFESQQAAQDLGINRLIFLDAEDSRLSADRAVAQRLRESLQRERPEILYLPFFLERHPDHRAANDVLGVATRETTLSFECRGYEVWSPVMANCLVAIDTTIELKRQALGRYASQLAVMDYVHASMGLNAWRAKDLGVGVRFAEAFYAAPLPEYLRLHGALPGSNRT